MTKAKVSEAVLLFMEKGLLRITGMETSAKGLLPHELQSGAQAYRKEAFGMDNIGRPAESHYQRAGHFESRFRPPAGNLRKLCIYPHWEQPLQQQVVPSSCKADRLGVWVRC